jgi:hypothetical protein
MLNRVLKRAFSLTLADARGSVSYSKSAHAAPSRDREGVFHGPRRDAKGDEDTAQPAWGQGFGPAAELPLGAELYVSAGSTGDLVAGTRIDRVFDRALSTAFQPPVGAINTCEPTGSR